MSKTKIVSQRTNVNWHQCQLTGLPLPPRVPADLAIASRATVRARVSLIDPHEMLAGVEAEIAGLYESLDRVVELAAHIRLSLVREERAS